MCVIVRIEPSEQPLLPNVTAADGAWVGGGLSEIVGSLPALALIAGILILSAIVTNVFTRLMYYRCGNCGTLNARRRTACRTCAAPLAPVKN
jgi:hypothetical protein